MLYELYEIGRAHKSGGRLDGLLNLFQYVTVRGGVAACIAILAGLALGGSVIRWLRRRRIRERTEKSDSPRLDEMHRTKSETPTMGGLVILVAVLAAAILCVNWGGLLGGEPVAFCGGYYALLVVSVMVWMGLIGMIDDRMKLLEIRKKGMRLWTKLALQCAVALGASLLLLWLREQPDAWRTAGEGERYRTLLTLPFVRPDTAGGGEKGLPDWLLLDLPRVVFVLFTTVVIVSSTNAVNLADGLDGLAVGCTIFVALAYAVIAYVTGNTGFADALGLPYIRGAGEVAILCAAVAGAGAAFLWFNAHPAEVFMGDTGSLALGGFLGTVAVVVKQEVLLILAGGIFVAEALSVLVQVVSFRVWGKRVFAIAPLHHHFQFKGWPESRIVIRFWIIAGLLALASVATLKVR